MPTNPITGIPSYVPPPPDPTQKPIGQAMYDVLPSMGTVRRFLSSTPQQQGEMLPPKAQAVGRGITQGIGETVAGATSPAGLATLVGLTAASGFAAPIVMGLMKLGFTAAGINNLSQKIPAARKAFESGNIEEGTRLVTTAVPDLAMIAPGVGTAARLGTKATISKAPGMLQPALADEGGFVNLRYTNRKGATLGNEHILGTEAIGRGNVQTAPGSMQLAEPPGVTYAEINPPPVASTELPYTLDRLAARGVDPRTVMFKTPTGEILRLEQLPDIFPEVGEWMQQRQYNAPATGVPGAPAIPPPPVPPPPAPAYRTPGGRLGTVTDPMKLQRRQDIEIQKAQEKAATLPPYKAPKVSGKIKQPSFPMEPAPSASATPPVAPEAPAEIPGSPLERAIVVMMEHNRLLSQQLAALTERVMGGGQGQAAPLVSAPPKPATMINAAVKAPAAPKVPKATTPLPTTETPPSADLVDEIKAAMAEAPKVELTQAELKGMGAPTGKKKGPVSYVGKTLEEKYAPKEAAAQPAAIEASRTPTNRTELLDAIDAFNRGEGRPVNIVRRGLGGAKSTRGLVLDNIKDMRGKATDYYTYMPENWSGDPFAIKISDMEPNLMGRSHTMNVPRHAQRTYDLGMEIAVPRKAEIPKGQRVRLPDGSLGTHVEDVQGGMKEVQYFMKKLEEAAKGGDPEAQTRLSLFKSKLNDKGFTKLSRVAMDDGRWIDFDPGELTPVEAEKVTGAKPSTQIKPVTAAAEKEVRERMTAAGGERAAKIPAPPPGPQEPGQPVQRLVTKEDIKQEARVSKPDQTYKGQRKYELAQEELARKRAEYKPQATGEKAVKPTPPPVAHTPSDAKAMSAERIRNQQLLPNLEKKLKTLPAGSPAATKMEARIKEIKESLKPIPPPPTKK